MSDEDASGDMYTRTHSKSRRVGSEGDNRGSGDEVGECIDKEVSRVARASEGGRRRSAGSRL